MSIIQGYEYDIFISYRQNDNKYDGWVTAFANNLAIELEATIKDKVSVYFDTNPHDGLLESHAVNKSLEDKLRCLIFIPIISRTYCDISSFAWQNEFMVFNRLAKQDKFGREIRVSRGNFASRILPVRIHELDPYDILQLENELGGALRSIDFVFRASGVNRPLRANEDHPQDNLNKTYYRDQINKVANAVDEIIEALKFESAHKDIQEAEEPKDILEEATKNEEKKKQKKSLNSTASKILGFFILLITIVSILFKLLYPEGLSKSEVKETGIEGKRISITVMPFNNLTNDASLNYLRMGAQDAVLTFLSFFPEEFNVRQFEMIYKSIVGENISDFSSISTASGSKLSKRLDADFFLMGDILKNGRNIRLNSQLISSRNKEIIKSFQAEGDSSLVMYTIDTLASKIRTYLLLFKIAKETLKTGQESSFKTDFLTSSPDAYRYHILAKEAFFNLDYNTALRLDLQSVTIDTTFIDAFITLCWEYYYLGNYVEAQNWLQKAFRERSNLPLIQQVNLDYQNACLNQTPNEQIIYLKQLQRIEDNNPKYFLKLGYLNLELEKYEEAMIELEKAQELYKKLGTEPNDFFYYHYLIIGYKKTGDMRKAKVILKKADEDFTKYPRESNLGDRYYKMAILYSDAGIYDKSDEYFEKGFQLNPGNQGMIYNYAYSLMDNDSNINRGLELINKAIEKDSTNGILFAIKGWALYRQQKYDEALKYLEKAYRMIPSYEIKIQIDSVKKARLSTL